MPHTDNVEEFLEKLGDFYEMVDNEVDGPVVRIVKQDIPEQKTSNVTNGVTAHSTSGSDSSPETSDTVHSHSNLPSHGVIGL